MNPSPNWTLLNQKPNPVCDQVVRGFADLLASTQSSETDFQKYIEDHCAFFFPHADLILGKVALKHVDQEHITDFVLAYDDGSAGLIYELVEIEHPSKAAFTKNGDPSQHLSHAKRQIADWKTWLKKHSAEARRLFPSKSASFGNPKFHYSIYIDRRERLSTFEAQRNQQESEGLQLASFDRLLDEARNCVFLPATGLFSSEEDRLSDTDRVELVNPFRIAYSDTEWRAIRTKEFDTAHSIANNASALIAHRRLNDTLYQEFAHYLQQSFSK